MRRRSPGRIAGPWASRPRCMTLRGPGRLAGRLPPPAGAISFLRRGMALAERPRRLRLHRRPRRPVPRRRAVGADRGPASRPSPAGDAAVAGHGEGPGGSGPTPRLPHLRQPLHPVDAGRRHDQQRRLMWVAIEATTIASAILIPCHRSKRRSKPRGSTSSSGPSASPSRSPGPSSRTSTSSAASDAAECPELDVADGVAPTLHPDVLRLAFVFLLVGTARRPASRRCTRGCRRAFGGAGAALGHDVRRAAGGRPIRDHPMESVVDAAGGPAFTNQVLMALGLLSIAIGALSLSASRTTNGCSRTRASSTAASSAWG